MKCINGLLINKFVIGDIPLNALRSSGFTFSNLTECIDKVLGNSEFPVYDKKDPVN